LAQVKRCPKCGGQNIHRIKRKLWMRFIPGSARYYCSDCEHKFLLLSHEKSKKKSKGKFIVANVLLTLIFASILTLVVLRACVMEKEHTTQTETEVSP